MLLSQRPLLAVYSAAVQHYSSAITPRRVTASAVFQRRVRPRSALATTALPQRCITQRRVTASASAALPRAALANSARAALQQRSAPFTRAASATTPRCHASGYHTEVRRCRTTAKSSLRQWWQCVGQVQRWRGDAVNGGGA